jgi:hypothetical protein
MLIDFTALVFTGQVYHYVTMGVVQNRAFSLIWGRGCDDRAPHGVSIVKVYTVTTGVPLTAFPNARR